MNLWLKAALGALVVAIAISLVSLYGGSRPVGAENLVGRELPQFAAPLAAGTLDGDANIYTAAQARAAGAEAPCAVKLPGAFNSCRDLKGGAIVSFFNITKPECVTQTSLLDNYLREHPQVDGVAVAFDQPESAVRAVVRREHWKLPVAIDRDGAVSALYAVAGCPTTFFVRDGVVGGVWLGKLSAEQLTEHLERADGATRSTGKTGEAG